MDKQIRTVADLYRNVSGAESPSMTMEEMLAYSMLSEKEAMELARQRLHMRMLLDIGGEKNGN